MSRCVGWSAMALHPPRPFLPLSPDTSRRSLQDAGLDNATKRDLQTVIQAHFKEWLVASGNMRQVYDLARMERGEGA